MTITTIKRCQHDPDWWFTVEDCNVDIQDEPGSGLCIKHHDLRNEKGKVELSVGIEDALLILDAINQLYPENKFPST